MSYHNFLHEINWNRSDMVDGYYAIPDTFCNFDPVTGAPMFEFEGEDQPEPPSMEDFDSVEEYERAMEAHTIEFEAWEASDRDEIVPEGFVLIDEYDEDDAYRVLALLMHLDEFDASVTVHRNGQLEVGKCEWLVLTDTEADDAYEKSLDNYIDECVLHELPEPYQMYFDSERWKNDARINGCRGSSLASYDGYEHYESTNYGTFYIFRIN